MGRGLGALKGCYSRGVPFIFLFSEDPYLSSSIRHFPPSGAHGKEKRSHTALERAKRKNRNGSNLVISVRIEKMTFFYKFFLLGFLVTPLLSPPPCAPSREGCVVNDQMTKASNKK